MNFDVDNISANAVASSTTTFDAAPSSDDCADESADELFALEELFEEAITDTWDEVFETEATTVVATEDAAMLDVCALELLATIVAEALVDTKDATEELTREAVCAAATDDACVLSTLGALLSADLLATDSLATTAAAGTESVCAIAEKIEQEKKNREVKMSFLVRE